MIAITTIHKFRLTFLPNSDFNSIFCVFNSIFVFAHTFEFTNLISSSPLNLSQLTKIIFQK